MFHFFWFQINWFGLVYFQSGFVPVALILTIYYLKVNRLTVHDDLKIAIELTLVGFVIETILIVAEIIRFNHYFPVNSIPPIWLLMLWFTFGLTLNHVFVWFKQRPKLAIAGGAVFGPFSYLAGIKLGAAENLVPMTQLFAVYAVVWGWAFHLFTQRIVIPIHPSQQT